MVQGRTERDGESRVRAALSAVADDLKPLVERLEGLGAELPEVPEAVAESRTPPNPLQHYKGTAEAMAEDLYRLRQELLLAVTLDQWDLKRRYAEQDSAEQEACVTQAT